LSISISEYKRKVRIPWGRKHHGQLFVQQCGQESKKERLNKC
jgi:hypothetical protein